MLHEGGKYAVMTIEPWNDERKSIFLFLKKSIMFTKAAFIWKKQNKKKTNSKH